MKVISFHLKGKMAHFRKFYSNSSALSYFIPPRMTVCGIVAGLLGWERDGYYEEFSLNKCKIAIASCRPIKKTMQKLNYLMIKSPNDLNGSQEHHSQTPMELVIPQNIRNDYIDYKIWIHHTETSIMNRIEDLFADYEKDYYLSYGISIALGSAFNLGWIDGIEIIEGEKIEGLSEVIFSSAIPLEKVEEIKIGSMLEGKYRILKEELPLEFDMERKLTSEGLKDILVNINGNCIPACVDSFVRLENKENIVWLE
ncbi:CRISPR-associated protein Cas5 [Anaerosalibacter sp. Marseille-P3206]|uniref:CRISPR-associated protein Cas5 n=1 Tax=Anaerosalibacter sp. Marseille-P3206 TaxID=1871005 RepID=UPI000987A4C1|nr:CRISPR-associated protein Cas5 [Anaerosalibacter sp. Marseille-P3206]